MAKGKTKGNKGARKEKKVSLGINKALYEKIEKFPDSISEAVSLGERITLPLRYYKKYARIAFSGMGASGAGGDFVSDIVPYVDIRTTKSYEVPPYYGQDTLFIAISFSGKTEETIASASQANKKGCLVIGMGIPTNLKALCTKMQVPHVDFPEYYQPTRIGAAFVAFTPLAILGKLGIAQFPPEEWKETLEACKKIRETCSAGIPEKENPAKRFARDLKGLPLVIYVPSSLASLGKKLKDDLAENSKVLVKWEVLPEANHNDFSVWQEKPKAGAIIVRSPLDEGEREGKGLDLSEKVLKRSTKKLAKLTLPQAKSKAARLFSGIYFGMFMSFYLRTLQGKSKSVAKTPLQDAVKKKLDADFTEKLVSEATPNQKSASGA